MPLAVFLETSFLERHIERCQTSVSYRLFVFMHLDYLFQIFLFTYEKNR